MSIETKSIFREARPMLTTEIRGDALFVKLPMIAERRIGLRNLQSVKVQRGWPGLTTPGLGYSYNGFQGVRLKWQSGRALLIGSKKAEQLATAIKSAIA
jgi:hypothetical protein